MKVEIIAELAQGFEGRPGFARLLLKAAAAGGADAAKYQLVYADELATPDYKYYELFRSLEMPDEAWRDLASYACELGIELQLDIFGKRSLALAESLGIKAVKLHGTDITNLGLLRAVAATKIERVLLGAGGAYASELDEAISVLSAKRVTILLGFQGYPTPLDANKVSRIAVVAARYHGNSRVSVGFADHASPESTARHAIPAMAIGAGARVLEKHLTLGKVMKLEDHEAALNPDEFAEFTQVVRDCEAALGQTDGANDYGMSESEAGYRRQIRRHVIARRDLAAGTQLAAEDLVLKRSAEAAPVTDLALAYGVRLQRAVSCNSPLTAADLGAGAPQ